MQPIFSDMSEAEAFDKIHLLPAAVRKHLLKYVEFLYSTYADAPAEAKTDTEGDFFEENELTEAGKDFLEQRIEKALENPEKNVPWREVREQIHKKHNLGS